MPRNLTGKAQDSVTEFGLQIAEFFPMRRLAFALVPFAHSPTRHHA